MNVRSKFTIYIAVVFLSSSIAIADINDGLIAHYPFNGNANDESGNENHGSVNGATLIRDRFGNSNSAYSFDGAKNHIVTPKNGFDKQIGTVAMWINPNDLSGRYGLWTIYRNDLNRIRFEINDQKLALIISYPTGVILKEELLDNSSVNKWYYVVMTYDFVNDIYKTYQNGTLLSQINTNYDSMDVTPSEMYIGIAKDFDDDDNDGSSFDFGFSGLIDDVRIYSRVLSDAEIQQLYQKEASDTNECWATYENGKLHIPCIKVKSAFGEEIKYEADMQYKPLSEPMSFELTGAKQK